MKRISFIIETLVGLVLLWIINLVFFASNPGFVGIAPHPYLYLLILITIRYGYAKALVCLGATGASYAITVALTIGHWDYALFSPLATFIIFVTLVGIMTDTYRSKLSKSYEQIRVLTKIGDGLKTSNDKFKLLNEELSNRLIAEKSTFTILYKIARKLSTLNTETLIDAIIELVDKVIGSENCALFFIEGNQLVLYKAKHKAAVMKNFPGHELLNQAIREKKCFSVKDIISVDSGENDEVFLCGPLLAGSEGEAVGIILAQGLDFVKYNPATVRIFTLICDWASIAYANIQQYQLVQESGFSIEAAKYDGSEFDGIFQYGITEAQIQEQVDKVCKD